MLSDRRRLYETQIGRLDSHFPFLFAAMALIRHLKGVSRTPGRLAHRSGRAVHIRRLLQLSAGGCFAGATG